MQYDYGLRQGRSRPLSDRPDTLVSAKGKVIAVDKKVAEDNEEVLENGRVRMLFSRPWVPFLTDCPTLTGTIGCSQTIGARISPRIGCLYS